MPRQYACYRTHSHIAPYHEGVFRKRSLKGGTTRAQWEDVTGSTPLTFVNDCVSFTTTVSARFWLMDCRNIADATKMATELYKEAIHVPFMAKFVVFAKRTDPLEARLRVFCMTDDREDKTLEHQEHFTEVAKSRDVEVLEDKPQYIELAGNLVPVTKSGEQLSLPFKAFRENRLPFAVRVKDQHADIVGRTLFMREPKIAKGEPPQQPICILNIVLPETIIPEHTTTIQDSHEILLRVGRSRAVAPPRQLLVDDQNYLGELRVVDISNLLGEDWIRLAPEIGVSETDVENIIAQIPTSTAQQAQAMLKQFQSKPNNDFNILENGLRTIHRDDIVDRCIRSATTTGTTTTVTMRNKTSFSIGKRSVDSAAEILTETDSISKMAQKDDRLSKKESTKYSVEEKTVEESEESEEELVKKTVAERRKQIEKRLSADRSIPASTQKKELVEEIITIKRQSVIDDTRARHEEEILMQKPIDNTYKSATMPEPVVKLKTAVVKDGPTVRKDEFDQELQDKFKTTLKNVEEFEHKSEVLEQLGSDVVTVKSVSSSPRVVEELKKKPEESLPEAVQVDSEKQQWRQSSNEVVSPVPRERAPVPAKRTSLTKEPEELHGIVEESIKDVKQRISSFETKTKTETLVGSKHSSTDTSSARDSWNEEHRKELKQAVEEHAARSAQMSEDSESELIARKEVTTSQEQRTVDELSKTTSQQDTTKFEQIKTHHHGVSFAHEKESFSDDPASSDGQPVVEDARWREQDSEPSSMSEARHVQQVTTTTEESFSQQFKSETVSKVEETLTKVAAKSAATVLDAGSKLTQSVDYATTGKDDRGLVREEFVARSAESSSFVDRKVESVVREQRNEEPVVEKRDVHREVKESSDKMAEAHLKEIVAGDKGSAPLESSTEAYTVESFDGVRRETTSSDPSGTLAELSGTAVSTVETAVRQGEDMVSEKIVEKEEELRRTEKKVSAESVETPAVTETVSRTISQEITSKIPVPSKKASPDAKDHSEAEAPLANESIETEQKLVFDVENTQSAAEQMEATVSKIPRFGVPKPAGKPDVTPVKSPEPDSASLSKIPIFKDRKVSEQISSDSCETVICQKSLAEQSSHRGPTDGTVSEVKFWDRVGSEPDDAILRDDDEEVIRATSKCDRELTEIITKDHRAVTPDDFIDEIIEEAHDKVQQLQSADVTVGTLDLSRSEEEQFDKSAYPMPEYVSEGHVSSRYDENESLAEDEEQDQEKWKDTFTEHDDALQTSASFEGDDDEYLVLVHSEAARLVDSVLEQSVSIVSVSSQPLGGPLTADRELQAPSDSEQYAIRSDILSSADGGLVVKSPTIESMSGKSFDDNMSNPEYDPLVLGTSSSPSVPRRPSDALGEQCAELPEGMPHDEARARPDRGYKTAILADDGVDGDGGDGDDGCKEGSEDHGEGTPDSAAAAATNARRAKQVERKYARLSADLGPEVLLDKNQEYDDAISQIKDEVSILQSEYSKLSWDESMSATTGDFGSSTPDNDLQETETQLQTQEPNVPKTALRTQTKPAIAAATVELAVSDAPPCGAVDAVTTAITTTATVAVATSTTSAESTTSSSLHGKVEEKSVSLTATEPERPSDSSSYEGHPLPKPRTSISSRTDTATRSSLLESFEHQDSIEQYPEPVAAEDASTGAKFFIGECSSDIITRTSNTTTTTTGVTAADRRLDFAFDNEGYTQGSEDEPRQDAFEVYHQQVRQDDSFTLDSLKELDIGARSTTAPVVHSPVAPVTIPLREEPLSGGSQRYSSMTSDELTIAKTLDEVKESLDAVQDELQEAVMDGSTIKQSPSEFELKVLPATHYAHDPIYETSHEEVAPTATGMGAGEKSDLSDVESKDRTGVSPFRIDEATVWGTAGSSDSSQAKLDVTTRVRKGPHAVRGSQRWSATDVDSSGESHYQSLEHTDSSRPVSSDLENVMAHVSSEYETALEHSTVRTSATGTEYHSAVSTLHSYPVSSHDSMKSFDSESSGNLASIESEATETLVPSTMDGDFDSSDAPLIHDDSEDDLRDKLLLLDDREELSSTASSIPIAMKRSHEMDFAELKHEDRGEHRMEFEADVGVPEHDEKLSSSIGTAHDLVASMQAAGFEDSKTDQLSEETKLGTSVEDGSILSISLSSASNLETIMENLSERTATAATHTDVGLDAVTPTGSGVALLLGDVTLTSTVLTEGDVNFLNTQATTEIIQQTDQADAREEADADAGESGRKRGHKRTESTAIVSGKFMAEMEENRDSLESQDDSLSLEASKPSSSERDETRDESSDSDYDRYESEYSRSFRAPVAQSKKKDKMVGDVFEKDLAELDRRNSFSPSQSVIETIVEDVHAETEQGDEAHRLMVSKSQRLQEYRESSTQNIPDIHVTAEVTEGGEEDDQSEDCGAPAPTAPVASTSGPAQPEPPVRPMPDPVPTVVQYAKQEEFQLTEEQYQELIEQKYKAKLADTTTKYGFDVDEKDDSAGSDSFEMLEQPDISDEFVIVEEVAREAHEFDSEGKSVAIKPVKLEKKHDEDVEKMLVKSAPANTNAGSLYAANMREDMMYEFEESPPTGTGGTGPEEVEGAGVTMDLLNNGYPLEESKRWVEMQLAETQNFRYPYEDRLEDIKEEDTDFEVGSSRIGSIKDSFSSTPDYDMLARRMASREHDDISMSSLQEFESLEQVISLENRKMQQGSQDSLSNGSFTRRFMQRGGVHGDDISLSSLKEFEGLESACIEAHLTEIKAKEEAALLLSRSDESNKSDRSNGAKRSPPTNGAGARQASGGAVPQTVSTTVTRTVTTVGGRSGAGPSEVLYTEVVKKTGTELGKDASPATVTSTVVTSISRESSVPFEEEDTSHLLTVSSDSLDGAVRAPKQALSSRGDTQPSAHSSSDSLEIHGKNNVDVMTSSMDSIEFSKAGLATTRSSQSDSIEHMLQQQPPRSDSTDSIEAQHQQQHQEPGPDTSSPTKSLHGQRSDGTAVAGGSQQHTMYTTTTTVHVAGGMQKDISADSLTGPDAAFLTSTESLETSSTATNATYQNETDSQMSSSVTSCDSITMVDTLGGPGMDSFHVGIELQQQQQATYAQQRQQQQQQQVYRSSQIASSSATVTTASSSSSAATSSASAFHGRTTDIELLSRELFPGDMAFDEVTKETVKDKPQSKSTDKED
ncbi:ankyrin-2-like [Anopheles cruzii]|uniref:ankyrin-2-like n=1 Tax=Anopheles cruzii TaxID=68878 RepID=UPI0022EC659F|nr:ankyrin-2-like [Anopheles cruzii]